jgi:hypothetical protein
MASGGSTEATVSGGAGWQRWQKQRRMKKNDGVLGLIKESPVLLEGTRG